MANKLFCNPIHSHSDIFKIICDYKHQLEYAEARKLIYNNMIFKRICSDIKFKTYVEWNCWSKINDYNCKIRYWFSNQRHNLSFVYHECNKTITYRFMMEIFKRAFR